MKRATAAETKQAYLSKQRALVRSLIEQNGWSSVVSVTQPAEMVSSDKSLPDNVIPFPPIGTRSRAS
jgi:hypothetical protein